jgi:hypothetical protein
MTAHGRVRAWKISFSALLIPLAVSCQTAQHSGVANEGSQGEPIGLASGAGISGATTSRDARATATPANLVAAYGQLADEILAARREERRLVRSILIATHDAAVDRIAEVRTSLQSGDLATARGALEDLAVFVAQIGTEGDHAVAGIRKRLTEGGHHFHPEHAPANGSPGSHHATPEGHSAGAPHASGGHRADARHAAEGGVATDSDTAVESAGSETSETPRNGASAATKNGHADSSGAHHSGASEPSVANAGESDAPTGAGQQGGGHHATGQHANGQHATGNHGFDTGFVIVDRTTKRVFLEAAQGFSRLSVDPVPAAIEAEWQKVETAWRGIEERGPASDSTARNR